MAGMNSGKHENPESRSPFFSLDQVRPGTSVRVKQLPDSPEVTHRLREIGFGEEQTIRLLSSHTHVICQVCQSRLAIGVQLARSILVEPIVHPLGARNDSATNAFAGVRRALAPG
jgi:Fe2+ transport system protein FeoA